MELSMLDSISTTLAGWILWLHGVLWERGGGSWSWSCCWCLWCACVCVAAGVPATAAGGLEATAATAGHAEHTGNHRASHRPRSTCAIWCPPPQLPPFVFPFSSCLSSLMSCLGSEVVGRQAFFHNILQWSIVEVEMLLPHARIQTCQGFPLLFLEVVRI